MEAASPSMEFEDSDAQNDEPLLASHASRSRRIVTYLDTSKDRLSGLQRRLSRLQTSELILGLALLYSVLLTVYWMKASHQSPYDFTKADSLPKLLNDIPWTPSLMGDVGIDPAFPRTLYPRNLGKDILLLDVDTRPWIIEEPDHMAGTTWGRLNHYFYALMHGYDYKYLRAAWPPADTHATWAKLPAIRDTLKQKYKFVVFTDSDVIFPHLKMPLEYLFEYWDITSDIALAMAQTPPGPEHQDNVTHRLNLNSGFIIAQNIPATHEMLQAWVDCPSDKQFPGCSHWKDEYWHEQGAFGNYVRYAYPDRTREIACGEANGSPFHDNIPCRGSLISHYWEHTDQLATGVQRSLAELVLPSAIENMMNMWATKP